MSFSQQSSLLYLVTDLGNTRAKVAVFKGNDLEHLIILEDASPGAFKEVISNLPYAPVMFDAAIISSVAKDASPYLEVLPGKVKFDLTGQTPVPITNDYQSPQSLGKDRLAAVIAARDLMPGRDVLVIDLGTAITYDFINAHGAYKGGGIAPGIVMRFKALHTFTHRLPLVEPKPVAELVGKNTEESILSGVINGAKAEVTGIIEEYRRNFPSVEVIVTGGDFFYFEKILKNNIFAHPNLVLLGLKQILDYNLEN